MLPPVDRIANTRRTPRGAVRHLSRAAQGGGIHTLDLDRKVPLTFDDAIAAEDIEASLQNGIDTPDD